jgi:hypothetical protein
MFYFGLYIILYPLEDKVACPRTEGARTQSIKDLEMGACSKSKDAQQRRCVLRRPGSKYGSSLPHP